MGDEVFLDIESHYGTKAVCEISIIARNGRTLFCSPVNPGFDTKNQLGEKGLNDDILSSSPTWQDIEPLVEKILEDKVVISWWMDNEKQFFSNRLANARRTLCAMKRFSPLALNYNSNFGDYQNIKLWDAVRYTKTPFPSECRQHRAWIDAEVMRRLWIWMENLSVNFENKALSLTVV